MDVLKDMRVLLDEVLTLGGRSASFTRDTPLLGGIPELDSMAVVSLISLMEERYGFVIEDDEIDGATFQSLGSLTDFVAGKLACR